MVMLSIPIQRGRLRRTAVLTVLAWVFAMFAGVVNACLVQTHAPGAHASIASSQSDVAERGLHASLSPHGLEGDHHADAGRNGWPDAGNTVCLKFCDDESSTVASGELTQADLLGAVLVASVDWQSLDTIANVATWRSVARPVSQGPPLYIRFLRLTT